MLGFSIDTQFPKFTIKVFHVVRNSLLDIAKYISKDFKKFVLLEDAVSSVDGFEYLSEIFLDRAFDLGIRVMKTTDMRVFFND